MGNIQNLVLSYIYIPTLIDRGYESLPEYHGDQLVWVIHVTVIFTILNQGVTPENEVNHPGLE